MSVYSTVSSQNNLFFPIHLSWEFKQAQKTSEYPIKGKKNSLQFLIAFGKELFGRNPIQMWEIIAQQTFLPYKALNKVEYFWSNNPACSGLTEKKGKKNQRMKQKAGK